MSNKPVTTTTTSTTTIKMPKKPVSAPFDGPPKSTEQQLAEALAENEKFRETVNRLVDTHNAHMDEIEELKKENEKLKKDHNHIANLYEKLDVLCQYTEKTNVTKDLTMYESPPNEMAMYFSGMQDLVEHLCYNEDIITDSWIEHYNKGGLEGVKKELRRDSRLIHKNVACEECDRLIAGIHDQV